MIIHRPLPSTSKSDTAVTSVERTWASSRIALAGTFAYKAEIAGLWRLRTDRRRPRSRRMSHVVVGHVPGWLDCAAEVTTCTRHCVCRVAPQHGRATTVAEVSSILFRFSSGTSDASASATRLSKHMGHTLLSTMPKHENASVPARRHGNAREAIARGLRETSTHATETVLNVGHKNGTIELAAGCFTANMAEEQKKDIAGVFLAAGLSSRFGGVIKGLTTVGKDGECASLLLCGIAKLMSHMLHMCGFKAHCSMHYRPMFDA